MKDFKFENKKYRINSSVRYEREKYKINFSFMQFRECYPEFNLIIDFDCMDLFAEWLFTIKGEIFLNKINKLKEKRNGHRSINRS